jgi:hypothetical protein
MIAALQPVLHFIELLLQHEVPEYVVGSYLCTFLKINKPGSSVSIVSHYRLDGRGSIPDKGRGFFL